MKLFDQSLNNPRIRKAVDEFQDILFNGTFNVLALNGILDYDNLYKFALKINLENGVPINIITENSIICEEQSLRTLLEKDTMYQLVKSVNKELHFNCICDYIRLKMICDWNINNIIDLDMILNPKELDDVKWLYRAFDWNWSGILSHTKPVKYMFEVLKLRTMAGLKTYDNLYKIPKELIDKQGYGYLADCRKNLLATSHAINNCKKDEVVCIVTDNYNQRLFELHKKWLWIELIDNKHFHKDKLKEWHRLKDENISEDYFQKLLDAKYIDLDGNEIIPEWR